MNGSISVPSCTFSTPLSKGKKICTYSQPLMHHLLLEPSPQVGSATPGSRWDQGMDPHVDLENWFKDAVFSIGLSGGRSTVFTRDNVGTQARAHNKRRVPL